MNEEELNEILSEPTDYLLERFKTLDGDVMILGIAGKMGITMGMMAVKAFKRLGKANKVIGVSRFSDESSRKLLESKGISTVKCDLSDPGQVSKLETAPNIIYMAGRKFGTGGNQSLTWIMNVIVPSNVMQHFKSSRVVAFSTGCVYPLVGVTEGGCSEEVEPLPVGEYAQSCLGRERIFEYYSGANQTPVLIYRLNYAIDLRYGVIHDLAQTIMSGEPVDLNVSWFNCIWQQDANAMALASLDDCESPASYLNITGPETVSVQEVATKLAGHLGREVQFKGEAGEKNYLSNANLSFGRFGYPSLSIDKMIEYTAQWVQDGGRSLGKPTHFEVSDGKF